jgi:broad specificity phosphatase PhoE
MRWLEVRRHSYTKKGDARGRGSHLSAHGVALARSVGSGLGPFHYVLTSDVPRTIETAVAMGYAVDDTAGMPSGYVPGVVDHHDQWHWREPFRQYHQLISDGGELADVARTHAELWLRAVTAVPDGCGALVVSHGGGIEPALVACLPDAGHAAWGPPFAHCEGVRLTFDEGRFTAVTFHRDPL